MNKIYRLVWSEQSGTWVAVAEMTRSTRKGRARRTRLAAMLAASAIAGHTHAEQPSITIDPAGGKTRAYSTESGVHVVDIETANERGLSHNRYNHFDVDSKGLVLNNGNNTQINRQSVLAGQVAANVNLVEEATVILNEVVSTRRSVLEGFTEVLGGKADVVVANPNGITCDGCGFINTDRATLSSGRPVIGSDGRLESLNVNSGDVLFQGDGAAVSEEQIFDIVARSVKLDGEVNGGSEEQVRIVAGSQNWRYEDSQTTPIDADSTEATPAYAVDSTVLGGMYAGQISVIATEAGVGVRMLGEAASSADDFVISSAGRVELHSNISAARDLIVTSTASTGSGDISVAHEASNLTAARHLNLEAADGQLTLAEGDVYAGANLHIKGASLLDSSESGARFGESDVSVDISNESVVNGSTWSSANSLTLVSGSLSVGTSGAVWYAGDQLTFTTDQHLSLGSASVQADQNIQISATDGALTVGSGSVQRILSDEGDITLVAAEAVNTSGVVTASAGNLAIKSNVLINNSGTLHANDGIVLTDTTNGNQTNIRNTGEINAEKTLSVLAGAFVGAGNSTVVSKGSLSIEANSLSMDSPSARLLGVSAGSGVLTINIGDKLSNLGVLHSGAQFDITSLSLTNSGSIKSEKSLTLKTDSFTTEGSGSTTSVNSLSVEADRMVLSSTESQVLGVTSGNGNTDIALTEQLDNNGVIHSGHDINIESPAINNNGRIQAKGVLSAYAKTVFSNNIGANVVSDEAMLINASDGKLSLSGDLVNIGTFYAGDDLSVSAKDISNSGTLRSDKKIEAETFRLENKDAGLLASGDTLAITADSLSLSSSSARLAGATAGTGSVTLTIADDITNLGVVLSSTDLLLLSKQMDNSGSLKAQRLLTINATDSFANAEQGRVVSGQSMSVNANQPDGSGSFTQAGDISNRGLIQSGDDIAVVAKAIDNSGELSADDALAVDSASWINLGNALVSSAGLMSIKTGTLSQMSTDSQIVGATSEDEADSVTIAIAESLVNSGAIQSSTSLALEVPRITNEGTVNAGTNLTVEASSVINQGQGKVYSGESLSLNAITLSQPDTTSQIAGATSGNGYADVTIDESLANTGVIHSGNALAISAPQIVNDGKVNADKNLTIEASSVLNQGVGRIHSGDSLSVVADLLTVADENSEMMGAYAGSGVVTLVLAEQLINNGVLRSGKDLTITTPSITNAGSVSSKQSLNTVSSDFVNEEGSLVASEASMSVDTQTLTMGGGTAELSGASSGAGSVQLTVTGALGNQGILHSGNDLFIDTPTLANSGRVQADRNLEVDSTNVQNTGEAMVVSGDSMTVSADTLEMGAATSRMLGAVSGSGTVTLTLGSLFDNLGIVRSGQQLDVTVAELSNSGRLVAEGAMTVSATGILNNMDSSMISGGSMSLNADSLTMSTLTSEILGASSGSGQVALAIADRIDNTGVIYSSDKLSIATPELVNAGRVQSEGAMDTSTTTFSNTGEAVLVGAESVSIATDTLTLTSPATSLQGAVSGVGSVELTIANQLDNKGVLQSGNQLTIDSPTILNAGEVYSEGVLTTTSSSLIVGDDATVGSAQSMSIITDSLELDTLSSKIQGAISGTGTAALSVANTLNNNGTIHSGNNLTLTATALSNNSGVLAENVLTLDVSALDVAGNASVVSYGDMTVVSDTLTFASHTSRILGAMSGTGTVDISVGSTLNNPGVLHSGGDLDLSAPSLVNTNTGGISALSMLGANATSGDIVNNGAFYGGEAANLNASGMIKNVGTRHTAIGTIDSGGDISLTGARVWNQSTINAVGNMTIAAPVINNDVEGGDSRRWVYRSNFRTQRNHSDWYSFPDKYENTRVTERWTDYQYYHGGKPSFKPQISAGSTLNISGFNRASNMGGSIAGATINVTGAGSWSSFTNNNLSLIERHYTRTYDLYTHYAALGPATYVKNQRRNDSTTHYTQTRDSLGSLGLFANTLNASGFGLSNVGSPFVSAADEPDNTQAPDAPTESRPNLDNADFEASADAPGAVDTSLQLAGAVPAIDDTGFEPDDNTNIDSSGSSIEDADFNASVPATNELNYTPKPRPANVSAPTFPGLNLKLPTNPNGVFVTNPDPAAQYLVESNPLFQIGADFQGSDYMEKRYGYEPEHFIKRLGDASYEAQLVRQQLVAQTGSSRLGGTGNAGQIMQNLMQNAMQEANSAGLVYGQVPTSDQLANLNADIMWMVETVVNDQVVLAPVVFLAKSTREAISGGTTISANTTNLDLESLENTGGTLIAKKALNIKSRGDVTNTSGTIEGGQVAIASTEGSIINETFSEGSGNDSNFATDIGRQASIRSDDSLSLDAGQNITNIGADIAAGGDASLDAGNDITFDTIADRTSSQTTTRESRLFGMAETTTTTTTIDQIRSGLSVGGNLDAKAGNDITLAGTNADIGGNALLDAGNDLNIIGRENVRNVDSYSEESGLGVGGGLYGIEKTTINEFSSRNVGSELVIGGNATLNAGETITVQGSELGVAGNASLNATDVQVLAGRDVDRTTKRVETVSFLSIDLPDEVEQGFNDLVSGESEDEGGGDGVRVSAEAGASTGGSASKKDSFGLTLAETRTTESQTLSDRSVGSRLDIGGNLSINALDDITLQGSAVDAKADIELDADNINLLAARNIESSSSRTESFKIGLYGETDNNARADASVSVGATAGAQSDASADGMNGSASAGADASARSRADASASASTSNTLDVARLEVNTQSALDITNTASLLSSGGNLTLRARDSLRSVGSDIVAENNIDLSANDMSFEAAQDISQRSSSSSVTRIGIYADGGAEANASAEAGAEANASAEAGNSGLAGETSASGGVSAGAGASADAGAKAGIGIQVKNTTITEESGSSTARVSSIRSKSGSVSRSAINSITDVGTSIAAATDFSQDARRIDMRAAENSQYSRVTEEETVTRMGIYVQADAGAEAKAGVNAEAGAVAGTSGSDAGASASASASANAGAEAKAGFETTVDRTVDTTIDTASQAVASSIVVGGDFTSRSTDSTLLEGTQIQSDGDITLAAARLDVTAARDTQSTTISSESISTRAAVTVGVKAEAGAKASASTEGAASASAKAEVGAAVGVELDAAYGNETSTTTRTDAVTATFGSGGNINIDTTGSTRLEGAQLQAADGVNISAQDLEFQAARNTIDSSTSSLDAGGSARLKAGIGSDNSLAMSMDMETAESRSSATEAVVGGISSGGNITINTLNDLRLEGTNILGDEDTSLIAGGDVAIDAARNTLESSATSINASAGFDTSEAAFNAAGGYADESLRASEAVEANIGSGGSLNIIAGNNASFEGTNIASDGDMQIAAANDVSFNEARDEYEAQSSGVQVEIGLNSSESTKSGEKTSSGGAELGVEVEVSRESASIARAGSIESGSNLTIVAGRDANFVGTDISADDSAMIAAGRDANFTAAESRMESTSVGVGVGIGGESERVADATSGEEIESSSSVEGSLSLDVGYESSVEQEGASIRAGAGGVSISSMGDTTLVGTSVDTAGESVIEAGGEVVTAAAQSSSSSFGIGFDLEGSSEASREAPEADDDTVANNDAETPTDSAGNTTDKGVDPETLADDNEPTEERETEVSGSLRDLSVESDSESTETTILAQNGSTVRSNATPEQRIPGVSMMLRFTQSNDGSIKAIVPLAGNLPAGAEVIATQPDGKPMPDWVKFDTNTGTFQGTPPPDLQEPVDLVVSVPQADGSLKKIGVFFNP